MLNLWVKFPTWLISNPFKQQTEYQTDGYFCIKNV